MTFLWIYCWRQVRFQHFLSHLLPRHLIGTITHKTHNKTFKHVLNYSCRKNYFDLRKIPRCCHRLDYFATYSNNFASGGSFTRYNSFVRVQLIQINESNWTDLNNCWSVVCNTFIPLLGKSRKNVVLWFQLVATWKKDLFSLWYWKHLYDVTCSNSGLPPTDSRLDQLWNSRKGNESEVLFHFSTFLLFQNITNWKRDNYFKCHCH